MRCGDRVRRIGPHLCRPSLFPLADALGGRGVGDCLGEVAGAVRRLKLGGREVREGLQPRREECRIAAHASGQGAVKGRRGGKEWRRAGSRPSRGQSTAPTVREKSVPAARRGRGRAESQRGGRPRTRALARQRLAPLTCLRS
eukprot:scaffold165758_cov36-Tisochrysis_lutea.AAC.1